MRIQLMLALLLATTFGSGSVLPAPAEAQNRMGRPVASARPSIARTPRARPSSFPARPAGNIARDRRPGYGNGGQNWGNRPDYNRPGSNRPGYNRPGRPGGLRPDNVVIVNGRPGGGYYDNGRYNYGDRYRDDNDDNFLEFVGKTAAVTAGVSAVSAVIGSIVKDKPSDDCQQQIQNGQVYLLCDGVWYTPAQAGGQAGYQVIAPPAGTVR